MNRYISLAFTGYRTEKLPFPPTEKNLAELKDRIAAAVREQAALGVKYYMSGVCRGADLIAADAVLGLRDELGIELWCAVPFAGHRSVTPREELALYDKVLSSANGCVVLCKDAQPADYARLYNERNYYMVNKCDGLIAICGEHNVLPGGTKNTVEMAKRLNKKIIYVDPQAVGGKGDFYAR